MKKLEFKRYVTYSAELPDGTIRNLSKEILMPGVHAWKGCMARRILSDDDRAWWPDKRDTRLPEER